MNLIFKQMVIVLISTEIVIENRLDNYFVKKKISKWSTDKKGFSQGNSNYHKLYVVAHTKITAVAG